MRFVSSTHSSKYLRNIAHVSCAVFFLGLISNSYKSPSRDRLLIPIAFTASFSFSEEQWRVGFRFVPSSSCSHFLLSRLRSLLRSPLRLRNSCSHWITPTFTTLSASTISLLSNSTLHGMFRFCCIFAYFDLLLDVYSF